MNRYQVAITTGLPNLRQAARRIAAIACAAALAGCATGPAFKAPEAAPAQQAQLYVYRTFGVYGGGVSHKITIDGKAETLSMPNGSWQRVLLAPGAHTVAIKDYFSTMDCGSLGISMAPGQTVYVADAVKTTQGLGALYVSCGVVQKPEAEALKDMVGLSGA